LCVKFFISHVLYSLSHVSNILQQNILQEILYLIRQIFYNKLLHLVCKIFYSKSLSRSMCKIFYSKSLSHVLKYIQQQIFIYCLKYTKENLLSQIYIYIYIYYFNSLFPMSDVLCQICVSCVKYNIANLYLVCQIFYYIKFFLYCVKCKTIDQSISKRFDKL
jgi:hypothetical protein